MAERHQEHYCWVKIVASAGAARGEDARPGRQLPPGLRSAFDSAHLLKILADGDSGGQRPPPSPQTPPPPPPVSPTNPPPPPPGIHRAQLGSVARRRPPAWRIERGSSLAGAFGMEVAGVNGDRMAAMQWIESEDGRRWREGAVGLDLMLFTGTLDD